MTVAILVAGLAFADEPDAGERAEPINLGLFEQTDVKRLFIDVEVLDAESRPMPGLTAEDFKIRLDYLWRKIRTVDDLCPCSADSDRMPDAKDLDRDMQARLAEIETRFILFLDFAQLRSDGRKAALQQARRWIEDGLKADDEAMLVAHSTDAGLRELSPFTSDRAALLEALDRAASNPTLEDAFPQAYAERLELCATGTLSCYYTGRKEYLQSRRSLKTLLGFLTRMDAVGGRKVLFYFHQSLSMFPGDMYAYRDGELGDEWLEDAAFGDSLRSDAARGDGGRHSADVSDLVELVNEVGAAATMSRTALYPMIMASAHGANVNVGANLADFTGGGHGRTASDAVGLLDSAGRGCKCIYRIGVTPPGRKSRVYRTKVKVRGRSVESRPRVHYLTAKDLWERRAGAVLTNPNDGWKIGLDAALVPQRQEDGRWTVEVQLLLDLDDLEPSLEDATREWEVGVLLAEHRRGKTRRVWEMLGVSRARPAPAEGSSQVLHRRTFRNLPAAEYELRAFVRDRRADVFGGAGDQVRIGRERRGVTAGAVALHPQTPYRTYSLPIRGRDEIIRPVEILDDDPTWTPLRLGEAEPGAPVRFQAWACSGRKNDGERSFRRGIDGVDGTGGRRALGDPDVLQPGECAAWKDRAEPAVLSDGRYAYRVDPVGAPGNADPVALAAFRVLGNAAHPAALEDVESPGPATGAGGAPQ